MDTSRWNTFCFGRFLVDLPSEAKVTQKYKIWGDEILRSDQSPKRVLEQIEQKEKMLASEAHKTEGKMFIERIELSDESTALISWKRSYNSILMWGDTFFFTDDKKQVFTYSGGISPEKKTSAVSLFKDLAKNVRSRPINEIPTAPGYCIDGGFIVGNDYRSESFTVDVSLPDHPSAQLEIFASTGAEENRLLERVGGFLRTEVVGTAAGLKTLRKRKRDVGPIDAEEYLVAASGNGQRVYSFAWESQGKDDSLSEPNIGVNLGVLEQSVVSEKEPYRPAFKSDEEALELWDAIITSIRLRPGAV